MAGSNAVSEGMPAQQHRDRQGAGSSAANRPRKRAQQSSLSRCGSRYPTAAVPPQGRGSQWLGLLSVLPMLLAGCRPAPLPEPPPPAVAPTPVVEPPPGLTILEGESAGNVSRITAVVADPERTRLVVRAASDHPGGWRTSAPVAASTGALAVINGGYFSAESKPLGLVVVDGQRRNPLSHNGSPVLAVIDGRARILAPDDVPQDGVEQAVQCGPRLVRQGQPTQLKDSEPSRRSAVGLDAEGRVMLAATTIGMMTLAEFAAELARIGCREAMNLDGGPSTGFVVRGGVQADGPQPMPTHLVLLER